jgi:hypothetical protein
MPFKWWAKYSRIGNMGGNILTQVYTASLSSESNAQGIGAELEELKVFDINE